MTEHYRNNPGHAKYRIPSLFSLTNIVEMIYTDI